MNEPDVKDYEEIVQFRYPVNRGDEWIIMNQVPSNTIQNKVISIDSTITVPAGSFTCIVYEVGPHSRSSLTSYYFIANGIGIIKMVDVEEGGYMRGSWLLNRYYL